MEIGGEDIIVTTPLQSKHQVRLVYNILKDVWPDLVWETIEGDWGKEIPPPKEIFFYENQKWADSWNVDCTEENEHRMVYFIPGDGEFTLVVAVNSEQEICSKIVSLGEEMVQQEKIYELFYHWASDKEYETKDDDTKTVIRQDFIKLMAVLNHTVTHTELEVSLVGTDLEYEF